MRGGGRARVKTIYNDDDNKDDGDHGVYYSGVD